MIIVGAGGLAQELIQIAAVEMQFPKKEIRFFDNVNKQGPNLLFDEFYIFKTLSEVKNFIQQAEDKTFTLGLGSPVLRKELAFTFRNFGGRLVSLISTKATIGSYNTIIDEGCQIMQGVIISNNVKIETGVLINLNSTISHDSTVGEFTEIACGVNIAGRCEIGKNVFIGTNSTINPGIKIGDNSIIGAGAVVIRDVPKNSTAVGNPARIV